MSPIDCVRPRVPRAVRIAAGLKLISARVDKEAMLRVVFSISVAALAVALAAFFRLPH
jgi:hypothetical protein